MWREFDLPNYYVNIVYRNAGSWIVLEYRLRIHIFCVPCADNEVYVLQRNSDEYYNDAPGTIDNILIAPFKQNGNVFIECWKSLRGIQNAMA